MDTPKLSQPELNFKTPELRAAYAAAYEATLKLWDVAYEDIEVDTRYGITHILACGSPHLPALVLLPALGVSATEWLANISALSAQYRVYALDGISDLGKSRLMKAMNTRGDNLTWLTDVFDALGLPAAHIAGHSYGGWMAINLALGAPQRVRSLTLLAPAASVQPFHLKFWIAFLGGMLARGNSAIRKIFGLLSARGYQAPEEMVRQMAVGVPAMNQSREHGALWPSPYSDAELARLRGPVLLMIGDQEIIYSPQRAFARLQRLAPHSQVQLITNAGHLLPLEQPQAVNARWLEFLRAVENAQSES